MNLERDLKRDGRSLVRLSRDSENNRVPEVLDLETGEIRPLPFEGDWIWVMAFQGATRYAVWTAEREEEGAQARLSTVNADGTDVRVLWEGFTASGFVRNMAITSDGKHVLIEMDDRIRIVDVATGDSRILKTTSGEEYQGPMRDMVIQPNSSRVAFVGGGSEAEIWIMEGIR